MIRNLAEPVMVRCGLLPHGSGFQRCVEESMVQSRRGSQFFGSVELYRSFFLSGPTAPSDLDSGEAARLLR